MRTPENVEQKARPRFPSFHFHEARKGNLIFKFKKRALLTQFRQAVLMKLHRNERSFRHSLLLSFLRRFSNKIERISFPVSESDVLAAGLVCRTLLPTGKSGRPRNNWIAVALLAREHLIWISMPTRFAEIKSLQLDFVASSFFRFSG